MCVCVCCRAPGSLPGRVGEQSSSADPESVERAQRETEVWAEQISAQTAQSCSDSAESSEQVTHATHAKHTCNTHIKRSLRIRLSLKSGNVRPELIKMRTGSGLLCTWWVLKEKKKRPMKKNCGTFWMWNTFLKNGLHTCIFKNLVFTCI